MGAYERPLTRAGGRWGEGHARIVRLAPHTQAGRRELQYNAGVAEGVAAGVSALRRELLRLRCDLQVTARRKLQHVPAQALRWELQY